MTPEDAIYRYRLRTLASARELGGVRASCRVMGINQSACYLWKSRADSYGPGHLRPQERRRAQMPNSISLLSSSAFWRSRAATRAWDRP